MYTKGSCPDYRWSYDVCAPSVHQLIAELSAREAPAKVRHDMHPEEDSLQRPAFTWCQPTSAQTCCMWRPGTRHAECTGVYRIRRQSQDVLHCICWSVHAVIWRGHRRCRSLHNSPCLLQVVRKGGAMLPTVCAMALLPAGKVGQAYAPSALRHLMTDADSPIADLYQSCSTCDDLRLRDSRATIALVKVFSPACVHARESCTSLAAT